MVVAGTNKKAWWKCPKGPDHEWESTLDKRSNAGRGCPFCAGKAASITNSLSSLFPDLIPNWHPTKNGDLTPYDVVAQSHKKIWWQCQLAPNHEWQAVIQSRSTGGNGCPHCTLYPRSRQEIDLAFELLFFFDFDIDDHKENLEGRIYDCDIIIRQHQLVVEFDGSYFHDGRDRADKSKTSKLQTEGWRVIRVREEPLSLISPMDVSVPLNLNMKPAADAVLLKIREALGIPIEGLDDYLDLSERQNARASERFIRRSLKLAENTG